MKQIFSYKAGYEEGVINGENDAKNGNPMKNFSKTEDPFDRGWADGYEYAYSLYKSTEALKKAGREDARRDFFNGKEISIPYDMIGTPYEKSYRISYGIYAAKKK